MNKLFLVLSLSFVLFLTGCGIIPTEKKIYLSEDKIQTINSFENKSDIIQNLGKPSKEITEPKKLTKKLKKAIDLLESQKQDAFSKQDNQTIDELSNITDNCTILLEKLTNGEKVECLIYYWKTNDGSKMKKEVYIYDNTLQFTINQ